MYIHEDLSSDPPEAKFISKTQQNTPASPASREMVQKGLWGPLASQSSGINKI